jgi:Ca2+-binding EF-hand superfamily protein
MQYYADEHRYASDDRRGGGQQGYLAANASKNARSSFKTDFSQVGTSASSSRIFGTGAGGSSTGVLDEERRTIDKVFKIVDKDNSGHIDLKELEDMFKIFKEDSSLLSNTIQRIMKNVDKDFDNMISANEFYALLSQKFEKGDPRKEIDQVFMKMDSKKDQKLDVEEMYEVTQKLGESVTKAELKEMLKMFSADYQNKVKKNEAQPKEKQVVVEEPTFLTPDDFYEVMQQEIPQSTRDSMA